MVRKNVSILGNSNMQSSIEFAFFVDQRGRLKNPNRRIDWEGVPDSFALCYPYILAFEPEAIEIHNILTVRLRYIPYQRADMVNARIY